MNTLSSSLICFNTLTIGKGRVLHMLKNGERKKRNMKKKRKRYDIERVIEANEDAFDMQ